jgi:DNA adenine methylase
MITYDDVSEIEELYKDKHLKRFDINYSAANSGKKSEIIALSHDYWPSMSELEALKMNIR